MANQRRPRSSKVSTRSPVAAAQTPVKSALEPVAEAPVIAPEVVEAEALPAVIAAPVAETEAAPAIVAEALQGAEMIREPEITPVSDVVVAAEPAPEIEPVADQPTLEVADAVSPPVFGKAAEAKGELKMTDMLENAKTYAEEAKTRMQTAFTEMNDKTKAAMEKSSKAFSEIGDITKGNLEAVAESSKIAAKAFEAMSQEAAEYGRQSFEKTSATMKSFASVKSPAEFFQLQNDLVSQFMDGFASASAKNSEKMLKLASEISQPLSNRVSVVTDKMKSLAA